MSAPSLGPFIAKRPWLQKWVKPLANWYVNAAGYRQLGLRYGNPVQPRTWVAGALGEDFLAACPCWLNVLTSVPLQSR